MNTCARRLPPLPLLRSPLRRLVRPLAAVEGIGTLEAPASLVVLGPVSEIIAACARLSLYVGTGPLCPCSCRMVAPPVLSALEPGLANTPYLSSSVEYPRRLSVAVRRLAACLLCFRYVSGLLVGLARFRRRCLPT
jgi:hypothetical protein